VKRGYTPKAVRIHYDPSDAGHAAQIAARCHMLQAEMLRWAGGTRGATLWDGTLAGLVRLYEGDPDSPFRDLQRITQQTYTRNMRALCRHVGEVSIDEISGADVRRWYRKLAERTSKSYAHVVISVFKAVLSYGGSLGRGFEACLSLRAQVAAARFEGGAPRKARITYAQLCAFREAAHAAQNPERHSMALGLTLQHEGVFRHRDVIGHYVRDGKARRWEDGLTWTDINAAGELRRVVSKTRFTSGAAVVLRIADYPDLVAELERVPAEKRVGPLVINEKTGMPYTANHYRLAFREIARAAGIPDNVWCMDARAGAITEAYEANATTEGAMALAAHTQPATSRRYIREKVEQSSTVAKLRVGSRKAKE
jgi:hypothetical protein